MNTMGDNSLFVIDLTRYGQEFDFLMGININLCQ
jgi:hypothetical protein